LGSKKTQGLTVRLFGPVRVSVNGSDIAISGKKALALLLYLCRRIGTEVPRETICALLWPDSGDEQARGSLRQTLSVLRKSLDQGGTGFIWSSKTMASVRGDGLFVDANVFDAEGGNTTDDKIALYQGDLAEGLSGVSPEFDRWLETERRVMRTRLLDYLGKSLTVQRQNSEFEDALATAARMIEIDPLQEHIHRNAMEIFAAQGKFDAALRQYEQLGALLQQELGVQPDTPTRELAGDIRKRRNSGTATSAAKPKPPVQEVKISSIAPGKACWRYYRSRFLARTRKLCTLAKVSLKI
jgi:DNA-binding SARP family transcriptional activator